MRKRITMIEKGISLIEIVIAMTIIMVILVIAIPGVFMARLNSNEASTIASLRSIGTSQANFQVQALNDGDGDGEGEFGFLCQLAGFKALWNVSGFQGGSEANGLQSQGRPVFLSPQFRDTSANSEFYKSGYYFVHLLPDAVSPPLMEPASGGALVLPANPGAFDNQETRWVCYAYPKKAGQTGNRIFVATQNAQIAQHANLDPAGGGYHYSGSGAITAANCDVAYATGAGANLDGQLGMAYGTLGVSRSNDGYLWTGL